MKKSVTFNWDTWTIVEGVQDCRNDTGYDYPLVSVTVQRNST